MSQKNRFVSRGIKRKNWSFSSGNLLKNGEIAKPEEAQVVQDNWVQSVPGVLGKLLRMYGWLIGVYLAIIGSLLAGFGFVGNLMFSSMDENFGFRNPTERFNFDSFSSSPSGFFGSGFDPATYLTGFIIIVGITFLIGGTILAVVLKKRGVKSNRK